MRAVVFIAPAVAACGLAPASVGAQALPNPAARVSTRDISAGAQARDTMNRYAECIVKLRAAPVRRALSQPTEGAVYAELTKLAQGECLANGQLRMGPGLFRGAIYRALYIRDFGPDGALPASDVTLAAPEQPMQVFGNCVASLDPAETRAFVLAKPATPEEDEAVGKLGASFERCLAGGDVRFSKSVLQGALAEALYKRSAAAAELAEVN